MYDVSWYRRNFYYRRLPEFARSEKSYLISSLKDYKARERTSGLAVLMQQQADALSDQDIEDIAHYYSQLGNEPQP